MAEYYISAVPNTANYFKVAKFDGDTQPENIYFVTLRQPKGKAPEMHCDCPNRRRGKHVNDKHGQMVAKWLLAGKPQGYFDDKGVFHGNRGYDESDAEPGATGESSDGEAEAEDHDPSSDVGEDDT